MAFICLTKGWALLIHLSRRNRGINKADAIILLQSKELIFTILRVGISMESKYFTSSFLASILLTKNKQTRTISREKLSKKLLFEKLLVIIVKLKPGMALTLIPCRFCKWQDLNPWPLDCEPSTLTTTPSLHTNITWQVCLSIRGLFFALVNYLVLQSFWNFAKLTFSGFESQCTMSHPKKNSERFDRNLSKQSQVHNCTFILSTLFESRTDLTFAFKKYGHNFLVSQTSHF